MKPWGVPTCILVAAACALSLSTSSAAAEEIQIVLLDKNNSPLVTGDALILAYPERQSAIYAGFVPQLKCYIVSFQGTDNIDLEFFTHFGNGRVRLNGFSGRVNQELCLRADKIAGHTVQYTASVEGFRLSESQAELLDRLDEVFPDGVPKRLTNVRTFVSKLFADVVNNEPKSPLSAANQELRAKTIERVEKHLAE
jgi:hypothetical protein